MTEPVTCIGCGLIAKNNLVAFSDGMGYGFRKLCKNNIPLCPDCVKEIGHAAIDTF
jgi:hypothetical protein